MNYFAHDPTYSDSKYLPKRTISYKFSKEKSYEIPRNPKYDRYQRALPRAVYKWVYMDGL